MSKKRPILQRAVSSLLTRLESHTPVITRLLRYHSQIIHPVSISGIEIISRKIRWNEPRYKESYDVLALTSENFISASDEFNDLPVSHIETEDYVIHGHIKAPIIKSKGLALSYIPLARLSLTDSYPLPLFHTRVLRGTIIFIPNIENYFHLMVDYLLPPLCAIIREPERYSHVTFVMQRKFPMVDLFGLMLNDLGISTSVLAIGKFDRVTGGALLFGGAHPKDSGAAFAYPEEMKKFGSMVDKYLPNTFNPRRIFVTRKNASRRRILNDSNFQKLLTQNKIEAVELSFENPLDQVSLFRNSELIISVHGAALTNLIWSKNTKVFEIFPENLRPKHYLNIASQMGLNYQPFIASKGNEREDFEIDIEKFRDFLSHNFE